MEQIVCIDFGSSYTKIASRKSWNQASQPILGLSSGDDLDMCVPSTVACIQANSGTKWLIGEDALSQVPGPNVQIFQNWKSGLFTKANVDATYETVAVNFFRGLKRQLSQQACEISDFPARICIPKLEDTEKSEENLMRIFAMAGWKLMGHRACIYEPESNVYGITTRGRNSAWIPPKSRSLEPNYGIMFERDRGGLFSELRRMVLRGRPFHYSTLIVDIGSFTVDLGCVTFTDDDGHGDALRNPEVIQESRPIGVAKLDETALKEFEPAARQAIAAQAVRFWERLKTKIYNGEEAAVPHKKKGMIIIGEGAEGKRITDLVKEYADSIAEACRDFCRVHNARPQKVVLTGGGAFIRSLRVRLAKSLSRKMHMSAYDLLDENEPMNDDAILPVRLAGGGWVYPKAEVDARLRENKLLVRAGSAMGGCSVFIDLPVEIQKHRRDSELLPKN